MVRYKDSMFPVDRRSFLAGLGLAGLRPLGILTAQQAPPVKLKDQDGVETSLAELLKKGKVALGFYRSADW